MYERDCLQWSFMLVRMYSILVYMEEIATLVVMISHE